MKNRLIGGFFVAATTLIILLSGGIVSAILLACISLVALHELMKLYGLEGTAYSIVNYLATVGIYGLLYAGQEQFLMPFIIFMLMVMLAIYVITFPKYKDVDMQRSFFVFLYATILLSYVFRIRSMKFGLALSFFILISSWGNDVFAYLVGSAIGKHKITPNVSPNKSLEGFIGGILGAGVLGYVFALLCGDALPFNGFYSALLAMIGSIPADIGDLAASAIKRDNSIKDFSNLIPGHGGMVDRIDSVLFTAPITYYLVVLFNVM